MKEKKFARAPLLYIDQPHVNSPEAQMQSQYRSKKKRKVKVEALNEEKVTTKDKTENKVTNDDVKYTSAQNEKVTIEHSDQTEEEKGKRKSFREMTIKEKVDYFVNSPSYTPKVRCEVRTADRRYRGVITALEGERVIIHVGTRSLPKKVLLKEINDIRIIGF